MTKKYSYIVGVVSVPVVIAGSLWALNKVSAAEKPNIASSISSILQTNEGQVSTKNVRAIDTTYLDAEIASLLKTNSNLDVSISITDIDSGGSYNYGDQTAFKAASVTKLLTATMYLHQVEIGKLSLDDTVGGSTARNQLEKLIVNSDNNAWQLLNAILTPNGLEAYAMQIGITSYDSSTNTITAEDIALVLSKLYKDELLTASNSDLLLSYMQEADNADYIPAAITNATVYHKAGWLEDRFHDAAIIDNGQHPYVLVIFSKTSDIYESTQGKTLFHAITDAVNKTILAAA